MFARRASLHRIQLRACPARAAQRREWGTNVLYRDFVPMQMIFLCGPGESVQKGLTTARMTMNTRSAAGASFHMR